MMKKLLQLFLFFLTVTTLAQENKTLIFGEIIDSLGIVKNANIININTNQGTFSSDKGSFRMFVSLGDSIQISSIQHISKKIILSKKIIENRSIEIKLKSNTYVLDEFDLKRHNLTGRLGIDLKNVPTNKKDSILKNVMDFSNINFKEKDLRIDENIKAKPPIVNTVPNSFEGAGGSATIPFKNTDRLLRKKLARKKAFPYKVLSELGENFFYIKLKIPKENYFHFLEYCTLLGIENLHKENRILELIEIFQKEGDLYLKIIKKD